MWKLGEVPAGQVLERMKHVVIKKSQWKLVGQSSHQNNPLFFFSKTKQCPEFDKTVISAVLGFFS